MMGRSSALVSLAGLCLFALVLLDSAFTAESMYCLQCSSTTASPTDQEDCLKGAASQEKECGPASKYCITVKYSEIERPGGTVGSSSPANVIIYRDCSPVYMGIYCEESTLDDGSQARLCVETCFENACNSIPSTADMAMGPNYIVGRRRRALRRLPWN